jgi:hypothetical protein
MGFRLAGGARAPERPDEMIAGFPLQVVQLGLDRVESLARARCVPRRVSVHFREQGNPA